MKKITENNFLEHGPDELMNLVESGKAELIITTAAGLFKIIEHIFSGTKKRKGLIKRVDRLEFLMEQQLRINQILLFKTKSE